MLNKLSEAKGSGFVEGKMGFICLAEKFKANLSITFTKLK